MASKTIMSIKGVTFDLWDTLLLDDSDEPKRRAQGLESKADTRLKLFHSAVEQQVHSTLAEVKQVYALVDQEFGHDWKKKHQTWSVAKRLRRMLQQMNCSLDKQEFQSLITKFEEMELAVSPDMIPGAELALKTCRNLGLKTAIISDTVYSPGRVLREILASHGLKDLLDVFIFSDEAGKSKPSKDVFEKAALGLGLQTEQLIHVGDREYNDVEGAHAAGAKAIRLTVAKNEKRPVTTADAICSDYSEFEGILKELLDA